MLHPFDIIRKRAGMRIHVMRSMNAQLQHVIGFFGLTGNAEDLLVISPEQAVKTLTSLLHKDRAYDSELMLESEAAALAKVLIHQFATPEALIYTNGEWRDEGNAELDYCNPFTTATFDAGLLIRNRKETIAIWFEDED